jgi:hypothetical protein
MDLYLASILPTNESAAFWGGVAVLAGALLSVVAGRAALLERPAKDAYGFAAIVLAAFGGAVGLGDLAGASGWKFLGCGVVLALVVTLVVALVTKGKTGEEPNR